MHPRTGAFLSQVAVFCMPLLAVSRATPPHPCRPPPSGLAPSHGAAPASPSQVRWCRFSGGAGYAPTPAIPSSVSRAPEVGAYPWRRPRLMVPGPPALAPASPPTQPSCLPHPCCRLATAPPPAPPSQGCRCRCWGGDPWPPALVFWVGRGLRPYHPPCPPAPSHGAAPASLLPRCTPHVVEHPHPDGPCR